MKDLELFSGWRDSSIEWFLANASPQTHIANTLVVAAGEAPTGIHVVSHGLYAVSIAQGSSGRLELRKMGPGSIYGEMAWLGKTVASATVRAHETSESLLLPLPLLQDRMASDPVFGVEFLGSLARVLAARLQSSSADLLRQVELGEKAAPADQATLKLQSTFATFKKRAASADRELRGKTGLSTQGSQELERGFQALAEEFEISVRALESTNPSAAEALGRSAQAEFLPYLLSTQTALRFYTKPRGYAGDFLTIECIYEGSVGGSSDLGRRIDQMLLADKPAQAVKNRRPLVAGRIVRAVVEAGRRGADKARVTSLACGPARELFDAFDAIAPNDWPHATLLDIDSEALKLVSERVKTAGMEERVTAVQGNLIRLALGSEKMEVPPQDLVYSIGLIDYFNDDFVIKLLAWIHARLRPGGTVMLGNFHTGNRRKAFMDHILEWKLIHRSEEDMRRLFAASPFGDCSEIVFEEAGINLFALGVRR